MGDTEQKCTSGRRNIHQAISGIIVVEKTNGKMNELVTIGIASSDDEIDGFVNQGKEWIEREKERRHPRLDLFGDERRKCEQERMDAERLLSNITNITVNGADLILDRVFDNVGFSRIDDGIFRKLVKARLSYPRANPPQWNISRIILTMM